MELVPPLAEEERTPVLTFEGAGRVHGTGPDAVRALGPVSFHVGPAELVAVMGPSGSGKTTLLSLAGALDCATEGRVILGGRDLADLGPRELAELRRRDLGFVFQDFNLLPGLTALENVALPLELDGAPLRRAREEAERALASVRMEAFGQRFPDDLSGGERQRVAIARAVIGPRALLLADEPTGNLDTVTGELVLRLLRAQCDAGKSVVLVTHDPAHAAWADRVLFLRDGLLVSESPASPTVGEV